MVVGGLVERGWSLMLVKSFRRRAKRNGGGECCASARLRRLEMSRRVCGRGGGRANARPDLRGWILLRRSAPTLPRLCWHFYFDRFGQNLSHSLSPHFLPSLIHYPTPHMLLTLFFSSLSISLPRAIIAIAAIAVTHSSHYH